MFDWFVRRRRRRIRGRSMPAAWVECIERKVRYYALLPEADRRELRGHVQVLLAEKHFEGCQGFEATDEVRVTIAAHAACLLLHRESDYFPRLKTILVYPSLFLVHDEYLEADGTVSMQPDEHAGQSWDLGVVVLAWDEVERGARREHDSYNVVLHEFAHQLDFEDFHADGTPLLDDPELYRRWVEVLGADYGRLVRDVAGDRRSVLDGYGATNPAEFFAVATETFFEAPVKLRRRHRSLYDVLKAYYRQDPAAL